MNTGKCPKCNVVITRVDVEQIAASTSVFDSKVWRAVTYVCPTPTCRTVLGVQIDPIAVRSDLNNHVTGAKNDLEKKMESELRRIQAQLNILVQKAQ